MTLPLSGVASAPPVHNRAHGRQRHWLMPFRSILFRRSRRSLSGPCQHLVLVANQELASAITADVSVLDTSPLVTTPVSEPAEVSSAKVNGTNGKTFDGDLMIVTAKTVVPKGAGAVAKRLRLKDEATVTSNGPEATNTLCKVLATANLYLAKENSSLAAAPIIMADKSHSFKVRKIPKQNFQGESRLLCRRDQLPGGVANAIVAKVLSQEASVLRVSGAGAVEVAIAALAGARQRLRARGTDVCMVPELVTEPDLRGGEITVCLFHLVRVGGPAEDDTMPSPGGLPTLHVPAQIDRKLLLRDILRNLRRSRSGKLAVESSRWSAGDVMKTIVAVRKLVMENTFKEPAELEVQVARAADGGFTFTLYMRPMSQLPVDAEEPFKCGRDTKCEAVAAAVYAKTLTLGNCVVRVTGGDALLVALDALVIARSKMQALHTAELVMVPVWQEMEIDGRNVTLFALNMLRRPMVA